MSNPAEFQDAAALTGTGPYKLVDYDKAQGTYLYEAYDDYYLGSSEGKAAQVRQGKPGIVCCRPQEGRC